MLQITQIKNRRADETLLQTTGIAGDGALAARAQEDDGEDKFI